MRKKEEVKQVIYCIKNILTNQIYVGSAVDFRIRKIRHKSDLKNNKHHSIRLQYSYNKYGKENFVFEILEEVDNVKLLIETEQRWIDNLKPEYNMTLIAGLNSHLGMKRSDETKQKMSEARIGMVFTIEHKNNISKSKKGVSIDGTNMNKDKIGVGLSYEHKEKIRIGNEGKTVSKDVREKISKTLKSKNLISAVAIKVEKYTLDDDFIETYDSMKKAETENNYNRDVLRYHILLKEKTEYNGFKWKIIK